MLAVIRFRLPEEYDVGQFRHDLDSALAVLAGAPGFEGGTIGRNLDEPDLWLLTTQWASPGAYRRALSPPQLRLSPVWRVALDEPGAYEVVQPGVELNVHEPRSIG